MKVYHGTSYENYEKIMKEGFNPTKRTWIDSFYRYTYAYHPGYMIKYGYSENYNDAVRQAIDDAFWNARVTAAASRSTADKIVVLELDIPKKDIMEDSSDGAPEMACEICNEDIKLHMIKRVFFNSYCPNISLMYLSYIYDKGHLIMDLTEAEKAILKSFKKLDYIPDEIFELDYKEKEIS